MGEYYSPVPGFWEERGVADDDDGLRGLLEGEYKTKPARAIKGTGHVVNTLETALWGFATTDTFEDGALATVNRGNVREFGGGGSGVDVSSVGVLRYFSFQSFWFFFSHPRMPTRPRLSTGKLPARFTDTTRFPPPGSKS